MKDQPFRPQESQWLRNMAELSVLFLIAIIMLRGFVLEGYLISTGSMAPGLRGLHKHIDCPSCGYAFAVGVTFDESVDGNAVQTGTASKVAECPNCGQIDIGVAGVPVSHGDQLLVHKGVFDLRRPKRWETVVFRNPADPGEAYVKRVVGLPGETIQIAGGDLFVEGQIARKSPATVRDMRIEVFDSAYLPAIEEWEMPWQMKGRWRSESGMFVADGLQDPLGDAADSAEEFSWLKLRYWRWWGGDHVVETPLSGEDAETDWQRCVAEMQNRPITWMTRLEFDRERQVLRFQGVMPYQMQKDLVMWAESETFRAAVYRLGALSHLSPVTDLYAYNASVRGREYPVSDLMLEADLEWQAPPEEVVIQLPVGNQTFLLKMVPATAAVELNAVSSGEVVRRGTVSAPSIHDVREKHRLKVEVSNFDHRILVSINGNPVFPALDLARGVAEAIRDDEAGHVSNHERAIATSQAVTAQNHWQIGVQGAISIARLKIYRDVYYTPGRRKNAIETPLKVQHDGYFVQGDNSPVSADSRNWEKPFVPHKLLVGKPFIVHLPSRPGKLSLGGYELPIRIPDLTRIRYIH